MKVYRSFFNGIGSGAGVAWPLFGVLFTILGGSIGSILSLSLGIISITLFLVVTIAIFYFSYQDMKSKERHSQEKFKKNQEKLLTSVNDYLRNIHESYLNQNAQPNFAFYINSIVHQDLETIENDDNYSELYQIIYIINQLVEQKLYNGLVPDNELLLKHISTNVNQKSIPTHKYIIPAFSAFVGTFGAIAGCSAGVSGLLTGLGLFTSFAAFPIIGWTVISLAVICGLVMALGAYSQAQEEYQMSQLNNMIKKMHQQLKSANFDRELDAAVHEATTSIITNPEERSNVFTKINQPIISRLKSKNENKNLFQFTSFFYSIRQGDNEINQDEPSSITADLS